MGLRFDLRVANWLAHVLGERAPVPALGEEWEEREAIRAFIDSIENRFYSSPWGLEQFRDLVYSLKSRIWKEPPQRLLAELRSFLGGRPWTALLIPSGTSSPIDRYMCSEELLRELIFIRREDPGLILQLQEPPARIFSLTDVFPSFRTALAASTDWPGVLIWTQFGDSIFLPVGTEINDVRERTRWIFSHLSTTIGVDLELLMMQFNREFNDASTPASKRLTIVHLSEIHLGCREASLRLPRIQAILANLINDLGEYGETVVPLVSGDLMDTPDEDNLDRVRAFLGMLATLGTEAPIVLRGNHDVRNDGYLSENLRLAMQITQRSGAVRWFEDLKVGIACFDSVRDGKLARVTSENASYWTWVQALIPNAGTNTITLCSRPFITILFRLKFQIGTLAPSMNEFWEMFLKALMSLKTRTSSSPLLRSGDSRRCCTGINTFQGSTPRREGSQ